MSLLEFFTESKKVQKKNQVSRSQRVDHESITSQLRANHEPTTRDKGTYRSLFDLVSLSSRSRAVAMIFAVLVMSMANIGMVWGDTYADVYTNPASGSSLAGNANGKGAFSVITPSGNVSFGNSSLQIGTNGGSGTFTVASIDGSYITSIAFTNNASYPINTLTSDQGTITKDGTVYTFTPSSATLTSATFSMSAQSGKKVRLAPITVNLTSDHSYLSMNFGVSSGTVSCTKSAGASDLVVTTTGSVSSNRLSFGSGKTLTFTSEGYNISSINFTFVNHAAGSGITASTGTFAGTSWTPDEDVKTVTFSSTNSNTIGAISVKLAAATSYTVTLNPNSGSYASTPTGWTASAGNYTKTVSAGALTIPEPARDGYTFNGWKSGEMDVTLTDGKLTVEKDTTLVAQWLAACAATIPGNISKGDASGGTGTITLTAAGSPESGDTWYWQTSADGTAEGTYGSGATKDVSAAATWYIRSYNTAAVCWSGAKSVTVAAADLLTPISPSLSYDATVLVGNTLSPTLTGNTGGGAVTYALNSVTPAGSLTINASTGVVTAVTAGGTATVTATIAANGNYAGNTATSGTITVVANPLGEHTITWNITTVSGSSESNVDATTNIGTTSKSSTSTYISSITDLTGVGVTRSTSGKNGNTGKISTPASYDADKYVTMTFAVASGYQFTPSAASIKTVAVSTTKDLKFEISDASGSCYVTKTSLSTSSSATTNELDFSECSTAFTGTVTVKIYIYGATDAYRLSTPLTIDGTVAAVGSTYSITYNCNGATSGCPSNAAGQTALPNPLPTSIEKSGYDFGGWYTNEGLTVEAVAGATLDADVTLYAKWTACTKPGKPALPRVEDGTLTHNSATFSWDRDGATANSDGYAVSIVKVSDGSTVLDWTSTGIYTDGDGYLYNATGLTAETAYYFVVKAHGDPGYCEYGDTARVEFSTGAPAGLTALECNTLYKVEHMVPASITLSETGQYAAGLSANTKFEVIGDPSKTDQAGGTPEMKTIDAVTIDGTSFPAAMYLKRAAQITSSLPTSNAVKFIVGASGTLTMYVKRSDRLYLIKEGGSDVSLGSSDKDVKVEKPVTAGTYYIFAKNTSTAVYGIQLNCCSTPDAPTGFTAGSITSTGATFTITDAGDAASYDIYYSTSSDAPTAGTAATTTSTSKTKAVTGLTANTTYYAWVRAVCDADHKSGWVAADPFATPVAVTYDVIYHDHRSVSGSPAPETEKTGSVPATVGYLEGAEVTVAGNTGSLTFSIEGATATFRGWSTSSTGFGGTFYAVGANFNMPASDVDLYAVWSYPIEYNENGGTINDASYPSYYIYIDNESGSETVTATLPTNVTKIGYEFGGWFDNSGCTGSAITTITGDYYGTYVLYAKWTKASDCVTITNFETSQHSSSGGKPDSQGKYIYGYKGTVDEAHAVTITTSNTNNKGQNSNADMLINYGTSIYIYADNTTTGGTPATFSDVASISLKIKNKKSGKYSRFTIKVGSTTVADKISLTSDNDSYYTHTFSGLSNLSGVIEIKNDGNASSSGTDYNIYVDDISICQADDCEDSEVSIAAVNSSVCAGSKIKITSSGYEDGADFQWQKLNGSTWTDIDGETLDSLVIASAAVGNAGSYRLIAHKTCNRTSNTVVIAVPSAPVFGAVTSPRSVMATQTLSISDVEASDATGYKWYQSADATFDAGDTQIGTTKNLTKTYADEAIASPSYYLFCVATNSCGADTTSAIAVNVTEIVDEDCANKGGEGEAAFSFANTGCSGETYSSTSCWKSGGRAYYLTYSAPTGKYLKVAKVTVAISKNSKCGYAYSTDNGTNWTYAELTGLSTTLTEKTINLSGLNVTDFRIGRNLQDGSSKDWGSTSGSLYLSRACFEYSNACTATTVTPSTSSKDHTIGNSFTKPTFTVKHGNTAFDPQPEITYTSSNEDVATVGDDGTVTFQGKGGIVKITASYAGDETYCASEGYYTINVSCPGGAPMIVAADGTNMSGCNTSVTLLAKQQDGTSDFADGTYQWFRNGTEISGATSSSYTAIQAGVYTVERTNAGGCTTPSTNSATITSEVTEPEVERLTPFQYYHVDSVYPAASIMRYRHLFAVKNSGTKNDKIYQMEMSLNRGALTDVTNSNALVMDADTILLDLNKLNGKYSEGDTLKFICHAIDCNGNASNTYKDSIYVYVINKTRSTLALILNGKGSVVGGDFFDYEPQNLQQQTGSKTWEGEWSMYTELKENYIVTPVSGYAPFNKLNYEPFDIVFLTDFPKASKSDAAATILDDMADLCDFRPLFSFKTHMVAKNPSKWASKGFTTSPVSDTKNAGKLNLNIVCYAHPMFDAIKSGEDVYTDVENSSAPLVYKMLSGEGYENSKGMQGFEIADAENFVTIGLTHHDATITYNSPHSGDVTWAANSGDRMLVTVAERQTNIEARMILFSLNAGAHSKLTDKGEQVVLACLRYLLKTDPMAVADCSFTFDNGASNEYDAAWYTEHCSTCTGTKGDHKWTTAANWAPSYNLLPGEFTSVRIEAAAVVDTTHAHVMEIRIKEGGSIEIPVGKALDVKSTIRRLDGSEISPTENSDIYIASEAGGNGTLIFNNNTGDTKAVVAMYTTAKADTENMSATTSTWQYIGTPHSDVVSALHNYYDGWLYQQNASYSGWTAIPNGGPLETFRGYCVTHPQTNHTFIMEGTLAATTSQDIDVPAGKYVVMANSWVAPIDIKLLTDNDFENITDKSVYFFNTGSDPNGTGAVTTEGEDFDDEVARWAPSTYVSVPIHAASYTGKDDHIPSMQGFYVVGGSSNGTLHLDYDRHVRKSSRGYASGRMHAPKRGLAAADGEPEVAKLFFRGNRYDDRLVVLEREDFTEGYDSGWDGEAWGGNDAAPMSYVSIQGRQDAVSAVPEYEGTLIGFRAGEDSEYLINFVYSPENEPLYLYDTETNQYSQVVTGNAYHFTTSDKKAHERFILTRNTPQIATGCEYLNGGEGAKAKKLLIEDKMYILVNGVLYDATGKVVK